MSIGHNIKTIRKLKQLKQSEVAELSGVSRVAIGNYERGDRTPSIDILQKIADGLNVNINLITNWDEILNNGLGVFSILEKVFYADNFVDKLSNLLGIEYSYKTPQNIQNTINFLSFLNNKALSKDHYISIAVIMGLTYDQLYNWIISDTILYTVRSYNFTNYSIINDNLIDIIKIFEHQDMKDLIKNGLSEKNKFILKKIILKIDLNSFDEHKKYNEFLSKSSPSFSTDLITDIYISRGKNNEHLSRKKLYQWLKEDVGINKIYDIDESKELPLIELIKLLNFYRDYNLDDFQEFICNSLLIYLNLDSDIEKIILAFKSSLSNNFTLPDGTTIEQDIINKSLIHESLANLLLYANKGQPLSDITDEQLESILKKVTNLLEFEIYKIEKENKK